MTHSFRRKELLSARNERPLDVVIVPARVESGEGDQLNQFKGKFLEQFRQLVPERVTGGAEAFWSLRIPYVPYYAFQERLASREPEHASAEDVMPSYVALTEMMALYASIREPQHPMVELAGTVSSFETDRTSTLLIYTQEDAGFHKEFSTHLSLLQRQDRIEEWRDIDIGRTSTDKIERELAGARLIIPMVSAHFFDALKTKETGILRALERHKSGGTTVVPVILDPCDLERTIFRGLNILPKNGRAIRNWRNRDEAFVDVTRGIGSVLEQENKKNKSKLPVERISRRLPRVFISYSHKDEKLLQQLLTHLAPLETRHGAEIWYDRAIRTGEEWTVKVEEHLNKSQIILLLVSADYLASKYLCEFELERAMERHALGKARVVPVILRPVYWESTRLSELQALPSDGKPVTSASRSSREKAFTEIARAVEEIIEGELRE